MKTQLLVWFSKKLKKNKLYRRQEYPQTWNCMPKNKWLKKSIQWLCGFLGGHELSNTEWGYGGGEFADRWCRWCNKVIKVPKESIYFVNRDAKDLMGMLGKEEKEV